MMRRMPVDAAISGLLQLIETSGHPPMHQSTPDVARRGMRAITCDLVTPDQVLEVGEVRELMVPGEGGD